MISTEYRCQTLHLMYAYVGFDDAEKEMKWIEEFRKTQAEIEQKKEKSV